MQWLKAVQTVHFRQQHLPCLLGHQEFGVQWDIQLSKHVIDIGRCVDKHQPLHRR
jgi:hypothetical protein